MHAILDGRATDRMPVCTPYTFLYHKDHFSELTNQPAAHYQKWIYTSDSEYIDTYRRLIEQAPFDIIEPTGTPPAADRECVRFVEKDGKAFLHNTNIDTWTSVGAKTVSGHATDYHANQERFVFNKSDADKRITVVPAEQQIANGAIDRQCAVVEVFGQEHFIMTGGVVGCMYSCQHHVGYTNLYVMLVEEPGLIDYIEARILAQNIETIRTLAAAGGDAIYIDDATATSDMISADMYERFSVPYMKAMIDEIHRLNHRAILIYFGGIADRLEQIAGLGADGLIMEASMKGYVNDLDQIASTIGDRITLFGNLNPYDDLQCLTDSQLEAQVQQQASAGRRARGFVTCTGSPITPGTTLERVQTFIKIGQRQ